MLHCPYPALPYIILHDSIIPQQTTLQQITSHTTPQTYYYATVYLLFCTIIYHSAVQYTKLYKIIF